MKTLHIILLLPLLLQGKIKSQLTWWNWDAHCGSIVFEEVCLGVSLSLRCICSNRPYVKASGPNNYLSSKVSLFHQLFKLCWTYVTVNTVVYAKF